jgi:hypothetical protein
MTDQEPNREHLVEQLEPLCFSAVRINGVVHVFVPRATFAIETQGRDFYVLREVREGEPKGGGEAFGSFGNDPHGAFNDLLNVLGTLLKRGG